MFAPVFKITREVFVEKHNRLGGYETVLRASEADNIKAGHNILRLAAERSDRVGKSRAVHMNTQFEPLRGCAECL